MEQLSALVPLMCCPFCYGAARSRALYPAMPKGSQRYIYIYVIYIIYIYALFRSLFGASVDKYNFNEKSGVHYFGTIQGPYIWKKTWEKHRLADKQQQTEKQTQRTHAAGLNVR